MAKIKILRIITRLNVGGPAIHTVLLNAFMNESIFESYLLTGVIPPNESDMSYFAKKYSVFPIYISKMSREISLFDDITSIMKLYRIIKKIQPDIIHTHTAKAGFVGRISALLAGKNIRIHTYHGNVFRGYFGKIKTKIIITLEKILGTITHRIIAISNQQKSELIKFNIAPTKKIKIIPLGFDFSHIIPERNDLCKFREKYDISGEVKIIGIIGRLTEIKNHKLFIDIAEKVLQNNKNVVFAIIGDGELRQELERSIISRKLDEKVFITGFVKNLKPVYADIDLVLLTSFNEGTPVAIIESMAAKKIVCCTKVGGIADFIDNGVDGFYFEKFEAKPFVKLIEKWLIDEQSFETVRNRAYVKAFSRFNKSRLIRNIEALYLDVIERK